MAKDVADVMYCEQIPPDKSKYGIRWDGERWRTTKEGIDSDDIWQYVDDEDVRRDICDWLVLQTYIGKDGSLWAMPQTKQVVDEIFRHLKTVAFFRG